MPSMFSGLAQQFSALPPVQQPAAAQRRGFFGGRQPDPNAIGLMERIGMAGQALQGGGTFQSLRRTRETEIAQRAMAEQARAQREAFAATIQDPRERQIFLTAPDEWAKNNAQQFAPQVVGAGAAQVVNGRRTVEQSTFSDKGDQVLERSSMGVNPIYTRTQPSITEHIQQQNADTTKANAGFTLSPTQQRFGPDGRPIAENTAPRPMSAPQQRQVETYYQDIETLRGINDQLGRFYRPAPTPTGQATGALADGSLDLGPWTNFGAQALNTIGRSNENSRNFADFRATLEKLRNDSLRLNSGVQTEGDAVRAWNELFQNLNDEGVVMQRLAAIQEINNRAIQFREGRIAALEGAGQGQPQAAPQGRLEDFGAQQSPQAQGAPQRPQISREQARATLRSRGVPGY